MVGLCSLLRQGMDPKLREAAETDDTTALYALIEENAEILEGFDGMLFVETPLHIAAAKGHIKFAMQMVKLKPSFARKLNQSLLSPLHLAVENGLSEMALWLLETDVHLLRLKGIDGMTPLHLAVEKDNLDLLAEFLIRCPECILDRTIDGSNALHLAIKRDRYKAAKMLIRWFAWRPDALKFIKKFLNARDVNGDTPLHIAAKMRTNWLKIIGILSKSLIVKKNLKNLQDKTALDILEDHEQRRQLSHQVGNTARARDILRKAVRAHRRKEKPALSKRLRSKRTFYSILEMLFNRGKTDITDALLVVATLLVTICFQGVLSPPGGVFQASSDDSSNNTVSLTSHINGSNNITSHSYRINSQDLNSKSTFTTSPPQQSPGKSVMPKDKFVLYWICNTLALMPALAVTVYLLPPGRTAYLLLPIIFNSLYCYLLSISIISPVPHLDVCSFFISCITTYFLLSIHFGSLFAWKWHLS